MSDTEPNYEDLDFEAEAEPQETAADRRSGKSTSGSSRGRKPQKSMPKGKGFAEGAYQSVGEAWGKMAHSFGSPISPQQGIRQAFYLNRTLGRIAQSEYELRVEDDRLKDLGLALVDLENLFPPARLLNVIMPLPVAVGAELSLIDSILAECPEGSRGENWRRAAERRRAKKAAAESEKGNSYASRPYVVAEQRQAAG